MSILRDSSALAIAGIVEYASQLFLPVVLARYLSVSEFGEYRLVWLIGGTALAIFPFFMPRGLFYFLPRTTAEQRPYVFGNTILFLIVAGAVAALGLHAASGMMSQTLNSLIGGHMTVALFIGLWVAASLFDTVAVADSRATLQARANVALSLIRTIALAAAAVMAGDLASILLVMCTFAAVKFGLGVAYGVLRSGGAGVRLSWAMMRSQVRYAAPFATGNALFLLRGQADQWVVAGLFAAEMFALISIAGVVRGVTNLVKEPIRNAILPALNRQLVDGELDRATALIRNGNTAMVVLVVPLLTWLFLSTPSLVTIVYTETYIEAAPLMRFYLIGLMLVAMGCGYLLPAFDAGRVALTINACGLIISVVLSYSGACAAGLHGAVIGGIVSQIIGEYWALLVIARRLGCSVFSLFDLNLTLRIAGAAIGAVVISAFCISRWWSDAIYLQLILGSLVFVVSIVALGAAFGLYRLGIDLYSRLQART